jgi:predicted RNase H-like HicB family nuclease
MRYPIIIHKDEAGYGVTVPDFPGTFTAGDTMEEALANVQEAVECFLDGEDEVPTPSRMEAVAESEDAQGGFLALVDVDLTFMERQVERINITVPRYALLKIDKAAKKAGAKNRSAFLTELGLDKARELEV